MSMKKHRFRSCNAQKRTPSTDLQNCIKTRSLLSLPVLLCARHGCKNRSKSLNIYHKITTKSTNAVVAMVRNARCRSTCEHASKRVDFCRSRCCFAHAMDAKFVQNRRKSSMATYNLSTVVPAARRANLKCIRNKRIRNSVNLVRAVRISGDGGQEGRRLAKKKGLGGWFRPR